MSCTFYSPPPLLSRTGKNIKRGVEAEEIPCLKRSNPLPPLFLAGWLAWQPAEEEGDEGDEGERKRRRKAVGGGKGGLKLDLGRGIADKKNNQNKNEQFSQPFHNVQKASKQKKTHKEQLFSLVILSNPIVSLRTTEKRFRKKVVEEEIV